MRQELKGGCACGAVRYRMTRPPMFVHCCHCLDCQRQTGSAFAVNALIETDCVELLAGNTATNVLPTDSGTPHTVHRCPDCKVVVWSHYGGRTKDCFVRVGTLDQPSALAPDVHIFTRTKAPWVILDPATPAFDVYYDAKTLWPPESLERRRAVRP